MESPPVDCSGYSLDNRHIAMSNKIALIKFMRQVIYDHKMSVYGADGSLIGANVYVEKYFKM